MYRHKASVGFTLVRSLFLVCATSHPGGVNQCPKWREQALLLMWHICQLIAVAIESEGLRDTMTSQLRPELRRKLEMVRQRPVVLVTVA